MYNNLDVTFSNRRSFNNYTVVGIFKNHLRIAVSEMWNAIPHLELKFENLFFFPYKPDLNALGLKIGTTALWQNLMKEKLGFCFIVKSIVMSL